MSILSDLDPKNARLPAAKSGSPNAWVPWLLTLTLLLGGSVWLYQATPGSPEQDAGPSTPTAAPIAAAGAVPSRPEEATTSPTAGTAVIKVSEARAADGQSALAPLPAAAAPRDTSSAQPATQPGAQSQATASRGQPATPPVQAKRGSDNKSVAASKARKSPRLATDQRPAKAAAKAQERDIDIISAMVR